MKRRILWVLVSALLLCLICGLAEADTEVKRGNFHGFIWTIVENADGNYAFNISGSGKVPDIDNWPDYSNSIWGEYIPKLTRVNINSGITSIGKNFFRGFTSLTTISIPDSLKEIGVYTFQGCTSLTSITIPGTVETIGVGAFKDCSALQSVNISENVITIGAGAFSGCKNLVSVTIPSSVTTIGTNPFEYCTKLTSINVTSGNANYSSEGGVLYYKRVNPNSSKQKVVYAVPAGLSGSINLSSADALNYGVFYGCSKLTSIDISKVSISDDWYLNQYLDDCSSLQTMITKSGTYYGIFCLNAENGYVKPFYVISKADSTVHLYAYPDNGYQFVSMTVTDPDGNPISLSEDNTFVMPASYVRVSSTFSVLPATAATITSHPADKSLKYGYTRDDGFIRVTVSQPPNGHTYSFQWYKSDSNSNTSGTAIENAENYYYYIPTGKPVGTIEYYYCVVTSTREDTQQFQTTVSNVAKAEIIKADASVTKRPTAKTLTYTGDEQELVESGTGKDGTMKYSLSSTGDFSASVSVGGDAGEYLVYYKVEATDPDNYNDSGILGPVSVTIQNATLTNVNVQQNGTLTYNGSAQTAEVTAEASAVNSQTVTFTYCETEDGNFTTTVPAFTTAGPHMVFYRASAPNHDTATGSFSISIGKASQTAPDAPTLASATSTSITLNAVSGCEYCMDNTTWQDNPEFTNLAINSSHTFTQRKKEDSNHEASGASDSVTLSTTHVHQLTSHPAADATCTTAGNSAYWSCAGCGKYFSDAEGTTEIAADSWVIAALGHNPTEHEAVAATCTTAGNSDYWSCDRCGKCFSDAACTTEIQAGSWVIATLGHNPTEHEAVAATCTTAGNSAYWSCNRCGKYFSDAACTTEIQAGSWVIAALGHNTTEHEAVAATCTTAGNSAYWYCDKCKKFFSDAVCTTEINADSWIIGALGHDIEHHDAKAATCTADGWKAYDTCKRNGCIYSTYEKVNALGHDIQDHAAQAPTCTEPGWGAYQDCSRCDYSTKAEIPSLGHEWYYTYTWNEDNTACTAERECTRNGCGSKDTEAGSVTSSYVPANCSESAKRVYTASFNNDFFETQTETVNLDETDPGGHAWRAPTYTWSADHSTCTATHVCSRNQEHQESETVKSVILTNSPATCTTPGLISYSVQFTNPAFGSTHYDVTTPARGHTPVKVPGYAATCISSGLTDGSQCSVCGMQLAERKDIPPLGHQVVVDPAVAPTTTSTGLTEGQHCGRCGAILLPQQTVAKLPASPNYDKVEAFVARCYQVILGRNPDAAGLASWAQALKSGQAQASQIIDGFVNSPEFLNKHLSHGDAVEVLYNAMLGRGSDAAGKAAWAAALDAGNPFAVVINGFCGSTEFRNLCAEYGIQPGSVAVGNVIPPAPNQPVVTGDITKIKAFVTRCYQVILSRDPDGGGLDSWAQALATGQAQASQIIDGFVNSPEFLNKHLSNGDAVEVLYKAMLGRGSDPTGKQAWTAALDAGQPFAVIINGFCGSTEFTNLCASYGITPGSVTVKGVKHRNEGIAPEDANAVSAPVAKGGYNSEYINEEKVREFVIHCYRSVLGRDGDEQGIANYMAAIMNGIKTPRQVAHEFVFSPEFRANLPGNEDFIRILYRLYLNREADGDGLASWVAQLEAGAGLEEVVNGFASSQEFRNIVDTMR